MKNPSQDLIEWRRFGHWRANANKVRFAAFALWRTQEDSRLNEMVRECVYGGGDAHLALEQAFRRESAVALELIVKAVIAQNSKQKAQILQQTVFLRHMTYRSFG